MPSRSRQFQMQQDQQASWDRLRAAPWSPQESSRAFGSGQPRIQLVSLPSFASPAFWEVCQRESEWLLYTSKVIDPEGSALMVQGYKRVPFDGGELKGYFDRLTALTLPVAPNLSNVAGLDGTITQLVLFGGLWSQVRYQWWSDPPAGWASLVEIANEMLNAFGKG